MPHFEEEFKRRVVRLHLEGRSLRSLSEEYGVSKASISNWLKDYREECPTNQATKGERDYIVENRKLYKQLEEMQKENQFLKKAAAFFAKGID